MIDPHELVVEYGTALLAGDIERVVRRYSVPLIVALPKAQFVLSSPEQIAASVGYFRQDLLSRGVTDCRSEIVGQGMISEDLAYLTARTEYLDRDGGPVAESRTSYIVHRTGDGWKIQILSIDKPADSDVERDLRRAQLGSVPATTVSAADRA